MVVTWHLIIMIVITAILIYRIFGEDSTFGLDFSAFIYGIIIIIMWGIYGGIFIW